MAVERKSKLQILWNFNSNFKSDLFELESVSKYRLQTFHIWNKCKANYARYTISTFIVIIDNRKKFYNLLVKFKYDVSLQGAVERKSKLQISLEL